MAKDIVINNNGSGSQMVSEPVASTIIPNAKPLESLDYLGSLIKSSGKTSEQLISDHINEKYGL